MPTAAIEPRKLKAVVAVLSIVVNDYLSNVNTLLQAVQRQRKLLHILAAIRQKKRVTNFLNLLRVTVYVVVNGHFSSDPLEAVQLAATLYGGNCGCVRIDLKLNAERTESSQWDVLSDDHFRVT